ncbi:type II toxin-antitoxin system Phd/YefM family antitoxin [Candidatus Curtissbacteria bacterium]|nr:type II toxin-antitoxin system Phd/YefM family antitoxin [Candidatus Curtissbacteria bacterium]
MQLPILKSITDIRRDAKKVFDQVRKKNEVVLVTKNTDKVSVILSPDHYQSIIEENETLWEELEMTKSKKRTAKEKAYSLKDIISGKV